MDIRSSCGVVVLVGITSMVYAEEKPHHGTMVIVGSRNVNVLDERYDPKLPSSPMPAADGAGYLKNITGMSVIRKGGLGSDPVLRGMGMSRLNVQIDGGMVAGGCGGRMDPPTAYTFPQSFDRIRVLKGPQSLEYGAALAGTVLFEKDKPEFTAPGIKGEASYLLGSFGRNDQTLDMTIGSSKGYLRGQYTHSDSNDYQDGYGDRVRSFYHRENGVIQLGWTPSVNNWIELTAERSNGVAAYADRIMDGPVFDRESFGLKVKSEALTGLWQRSELTLWDTYIDHVMDNFSLRPQNHTRMLSNPDRRNSGGRWTNDLALSEEWMVTVGVNVNRDQHRSRGGEDYNDKARERTLRFDEKGWFSELEYKTGDSRYKIGYREDVVDVTQNLDSQRSLDPNVYRLNSGFARYEYQLSPTWSAYLAWGQAERAPDYWEQRKNKPMFSVNPERSRQWDTGITLSSNELDLSFSLFSANIKDFILYNSKLDNVQNISAETRGVELNGSWKLAEQWRLDAGVSLVHGQNESYHRALAQMPPLDSKLAVKWQPNDILDLTLLGRAVAAQKKIDIGYGSVAGQDQGETPGFFTANLAGAWRFADDWSVSAGIDNVLDASYYEHLSKSIHSSQASLGYPQTGRISEPGRTYWLSLNYRFGTPGVF